MCSLNAKLSSYRSQSVDLNPKSTEWFLYEGNFQHLMGYNCLILYIYNGILSVLFINISNFFHSVV